MSKPLQAKRLSLDTVSLDTFSLDTWAVLLAFVAVLLVRFGILKSVPW